MATRSSTRSVADHIVARIADEGTDTIFGVDGANIEDVYDAIDRLGPKLRGIVAKHEFGAATMADGYARTTNRLGVVIATSGGGALNLVAGLGEAFDSEVPVLALVGQPPTALEGRGAFQDTSSRAGTIDAVGLFSHVSRFCAKATSADEVPELLEQAIAAARAGGPAVLLLPKNVQQAELAERALPERALPSEPSRPRLADGLHEAERMLAQAARVVVIAGPEVARADARAELESFATAHGAPVLVAPDAKDAICNNHPLFAGICGIMGYRGVPDLVANAEVCVLAGARMPLMARGGMEEALGRTRLLHLGSRPPFVDVEHSAIGPLKHSLASLAGEARPRQPDRPDLAAIQPLSVPARNGSQGGAPGVAYREAVAALAKRIPPGADVFADAGNTGASVVHYLPVADGGRFVVALGMGGMGYAFGAGIGSSFGRRRRTFVVAGDGAFFMHGFEVHTAVEQQAPVTFVIFNNNAHAMCVTREQLYYSGEYSFNRFFEARIGEAVGTLLPRLPSRAANTLAEFESALDETVAEPGPVFISLTCDPDEIPPFIPFLKELTA
ncbi:MAG: thiamine pyrophosphate-binding protein [Segniliparus sp.]|uniref:thiamine pyrophosphate-binding protein n=1 Tax=Segniliparus sp. TaxID=2804064 RepID=UPI003F35CE0B